MTNKLPTRKNLILRLEDDTSEKEVLDRVAMLGDIIERICCPKKVMVYADPSAQHISLIPVGGTIGLPIFKTPDRTKAHATYNLNYVKNVKTLPFKARRS